MENNASSLRPLQQNKNGSNIKGSSYIHIYHKLLKTYTAKQNKTTKGITRQLIKLMCLV
jgi:hypothetical protein